MPGELTPAGLWTYHVPTMATLCTKPVRRKFTGYERHGLVVTVYPNGLLGLRPARTRHEHTVPLGRVYRLACELTLVSQEKARLLRRNERRAERGLPPLKTLVKRVGR